MKTKIPTSWKSIILGMIPVVLIALVFSFSFQSCQKDEFSAQEFVTFKNAPISFENPTLFWGHLQFSHSTGKPVTETVTISGAELGYFEGCLHLKIVNGNGEMYLVDNAKVKIDGETVVFPGDFETDPSLITKEICGKTGDFTLEIQLRGIPGSYVDVWIEGIMKNPITDIRDGNTYKWVKIGNQIWMSENLAYLPAVSPATIGSSTEMYYYVWGYNGTNVTDAKSLAGNYPVYGVLYNWVAAMNDVNAVGNNSNPSGIQGICPTGWHLPSHAEWKDLFTFLGGIAIAGGKLKETGTAHWLSPNFGATNESGFSALPGGNRSGGGVGTFVNIGRYGLFWSTTDGDQEFRTAIRLDYNIADVWSVIWAANWVGSSVRCLKN